LAGSRQTKKMPLRHAPGGIFSWERAWRPGVQHQEKAVTGSSAAPAIAANMAAE
jgi:hypothetical protein